MLHAFVQREDLVVAAEVLVKGEGVNTWCMLWTVEQQIVCGVGGKTRQLILLVVIDC